MSEGGPSSTMMVASGAVAGVVEAIVVQPFDMVKTRFQLSSVQNPSVPRALQQLVQEGGVARLYRGCSPELASTVAARSAMYISKKRIEDSLPSATPTMLAPFLSGFAAGVPEGIVTTPLQVVKVRLQSKEHLGRYRNPMHCIGTMIGEGKPLQFFSGLGATIIRNCVWNCVYFGTIPILARAPWPDVIPQVKSFTSGLLCGSLATCCNAPFDVAKSRFQRQLPGETKYTSTLQCLISIAREEGPRSLYKGFAPKVMRMGLGGAVGITVFESICSKVT